MNEAVLIAVIAIAPAIVTGVLAYFGAVRSAKTSSRNEALKYEVEANKRAREAYEDGIKQLEESMERLRKQLLEERDVSAGLRRQVEELEQTVARMRLQMIRAGIELTPVENTAQ